MSANHTLYVLVTDNKLNEYLENVLMCVCVFEVLIIVVSHLLPVVTANIAELKNLEVLNMFNNQIEELPTQISSLQKLKHLNLGYVLLLNVLHEKFLTCIHTHTHTLLKPLPTHYHFTNTCHSKSSSTCSCEGHS